MDKATVFAVMKVTIEIPVRSSEAGENLQQMHDASKREAEGILRNNLPGDKFKIVGPIEFSHAVIRVFK